MKNNYFYMTDLDSKIYIEPWDMELSFGLYYDDNMPLLSIKKMDNYTIIEQDLYHKYSSEINKLIIKRYYELKKTILNKKNIDELIDNYLNDSNNENNDKFIIHGQPQKQMVSLIFILNNPKYLSEIEKITANKEVIINYFVTYNYLMSYSTEIKAMNNHEFYSYGNAGEYTPENLLFSNNLISRITSNNAIYCLAPNMEESTLKLCSENNLYTVTPNIIGEKKPYTAIKTNLNSGSIILLSMNNETIKELATIIDYIRGKGLKITGLSALLSEELE